MHERLGALKVRPTEPRPIRCAKQAVFPSTTGNALPDLPALLYKTESGPKSSFPLGYIIKNNWLATPQRRGTGIECV